VGTSEWLAQLALFLGLELRAAHGLPPDTRVAWETGEHGGLYVADFSPGRGTEPGKMRLVLVIQTDLLNSAGHQSIWIIPCTTRLAGENLLRVSLPRGLAGSRKRLTNSFGMKCRDTSSMAPRQGKRG
jgi:hypothetical protein